MKPVNSVHDEHDGGVRWKARAEPPVASDPGEEPLEKPPRRVDDKAKLIGILPYNLDHDQRYPCDLFTRISAISDDPTGEDMMRRSQQRIAVIAIRDARRLRFENEAAPIGVDERIAFTSADLLARVIVAELASLSRLKHSGYQRSHRLDWCHAHSVRG